MIFTIPSKNTRPWHPNRIDMPPSILALGRWAGKILEIGRNLWWRRQQYRSSKWRICSSIWIILWPISPGNTHASWLPTTKSKRGAWGAWQCFWRKVVKTGRWENTRSSSSCTWRILGNKLQSIWQKYSKSWDLSWRATSKSAPRRTWRWPKQPTRQCACVSPKRKQRLSLYTTGGWSTIFLSKQTNWSFSSLLKK